MNSLKVTIPLDWNMSKNKKFVGRYSKVLSTPYRNGRDHLVSKIKQKKNCLTFSKGMLWVHITVYKTSLRGDCANLIECIFDGIKKAICVDDNYYAVKCDWKIDKEKPRIVIKIEQKRQTKGVAKTPH